MIVLGITGWLLGMQGTDPDESPVVRQFTGLLGGDVAADHKLTEIAEQEILPEAVGAEQVAE